MYISNNEVKVVNQLRMKMLDEGMSRRKEQGKVQPKVTNSGQLPVTITCCGGHILTASFLSSPTVGKLLAIGSGIFLGIEIDVFPGIETGV